MKTFTRSDVLSWSPCHGKTRTLRSMRGLPRRMNATDFARSILASRINAAQAAGRWVTIADLRWTDAESAACRSAGIDRAECAAIVFDLFKKIEN